MPSTQPPGCRPQPSPARCWSGSGPRGRRALARLERRGPIDAKGFPAPLKAWRALEMATQVRLAATPFIGRDDEVELLRIAYRRAVSQRVPELVTVTGEAGIGKTRLASELFAALAKSEPRPRILLGRNPPYGRGIAFWALGEVLRSAAGVNAAASVGEVRVALADRLTELGAADAAQLADALAVPLGGGSDGAGGEGQALKRAWRRLVALLAAERPLVIGLDDAHWADDGLLDLIEEVTLGLEEAPLLVLCTSRPELVERRPGFGSTRTERDPDRVAAVELRGDGGAPTALLPEDARALAPKVAATSGGNPFFAEEVSCRIIDDPEAAAGGELPETVQAAISARLDLLRPAEKRAIQYAAVLGSGFLAEALTDLLGEPVDEVLAALAAKALIQERLAEGQGRYGFRHQLIREVAYASLPRAERARLHDAAASGIVARTADHYPELAELVAYHRVRAAELDPAPERRREAYGATVEAAGTVAERAAVARAQELYEHAAELAGDTEERLEALRAAGGVAMRQFRGDQALKLRKREAEIAEAAGLRDGGGIGLRDRRLDPGADGRDHRRGAGGGDGRDASPRSRACVAGRPRDTDPLDPRRGVDRLAARPNGRDGRAGARRARARAQDRRSRADLECARCDLVAQLARWPIPRRTREHHAARRDPRSAGGADSRDRVRDRGRGLYGDGDPAADRAAARSGRHRRPSA